MQRRRSKLPQCSAMIGRRIAAVALPAVARIAFAYSTIIRSRVTLAMIEAAAIDRHLASPSTIALDGRCHFGQALPSTSTQAGSTPSASTARVIASIRAQ